MVKTGLRRYLSPVVYIICLVLGFSAGECRRGRSSGFSPLRRLSGKSHGDGLRAGV